MNLLSLSLPHTFRGVVPVSYTHLDVYKRQALWRGTCFMNTYICGKEDKIMNNEKALTLISKRDICKPTVINLSQRLSRRSQHYYNWKLRGCSAAVDCLHRATWLLGRGRLLTSCYVAVGPRSTAYIVLPGCCLLYTSRCV